MSNLSLYTISEELQKAMTTIFENDGEVTEDVEKALTEIETSLIEKTDNIVEWVYSQEETIEAIKKRVAELKEFEKTITNRLESFDKYVDSCLKKLGKTKLEGTLYSISSRKPSKVVVIQDESKIPMEYINTPEPTSVVMKKEIGEALKAGKDVPGASLEDSKNISISYKTKKASK